MKQGPLISELEIDENEQVKESKVGKILNESTQKAVITLVLAMLLSTALLDTQLYIVNPSGHSLGLKALSRSYGD